MSDTHKTETGAKTEAAKKNHLPKKGAPEKKQKHPQASEQSGAVNGGEGLASKAAAMLGTETNAGGNTAGTATASGSALLDPAVLKLVEYAKEKKTLSFEEISDYLPEHISDTEKIEPVLALLEANNVQITVDDNSGEDEVDAEGGKRTEAGKKRAASNDKEASLVDDPIRMYLREIGRESLLTAEQEIELSRQMEEGENIIKNVIKKSGMVIPEFNRIAEEAFSKKDLRELSLTKKRNHRANGRAPALKRVLQGFPAYNPGRSEELH